MKQSGMTTSLKIGGNFFSILAVLGLIISGCGDDNDAGTPTSQNIITTAQTTSELSVLTKALERFPDLVETLSSDSSEFTVFAPNDAAFEALLADVAQSSIDDVPDTVLKRILQYHVVPFFVLESENLADGQARNTALGGNDEIVISVTGDSIKVNEANIVTADVSTTNGIVHIIDGVLLPEIEASIANTVVAPAYFNSDFSMLSSAIVTADLLDTLTSKNQQYTVFAPDDEAFIEAGISSVDGLTKEILEPILWYHVLDSEVKSTDLPPTGSTITGLGGDFYLSIQNISATNTAVFINGKSRVVTTDIDVDNGVVHLLDRALLPETRDIIDIISLDADFVEFVEALSRVQSDGTTDALIALLQQVDGQAPFTVFAPDDDAFERLYTDLGISGVNDLGIDTLEAVLKYHIIESSRIFKPDLFNLESSAINTLHGTTFDLNVNSGIITEGDGDLIDNDERALIIGTDVLANNGVIHTINKVIIPKLN